MSKVISFRLDDTNPREMQALAVLDKWIEQGYSIRFIITKALLELERGDSSLAVNSDNQLFSTLLDQIIQVLEMVRALQQPKPERQISDNGAQTLSENFLVSVKQGIKPGRKPD
jgi:hypothetical protein